MSATPIPASCRTRRTKARFDRFEGGLASETRRSSSGMAKCPNPGSNPDPARDSRTNIHYRPTKEYVPRQTVLEKLHPPDGPAIEPEFDHRATSVPAILR